MAEASEPYDPNEIPPHPFWCDGCGHHAGFRIRGCPIDHQEWCARHGEDPEAVYTRAARWCHVTGKTIP